jgi:hypothetical protein
LIEEAFVAFDREHGAGQSPVEDDQEPTVKPARRLVARRKRFTKR